MEKNIFPNQEKKRINIKVEYKGIPPDERVFEIDTNKIEEAIGLMFGNRRKNLTIEVNPGLSNESGHYQGGKIVIWQDGLVQVARHWYGCAKADMGENPDSSYFITEVNESPLDKIKNKLTFLPHKLAGVETPSLLTDEQMRASEEILEMVRNSGNIKSGRDLTGELVRDAFKRSMAETFAHETGHAVNSAKITATGIGIYLTAVVLGLMTAQGLYQNNASEGVVMAAAAVAPILSFGGLIIGSPIIDEKLADEAQKKYFGLFIDAIIINSEVFERKIMSSALEVQ